VTTLALVTGSPARVADVAPALEKEGFATHCAPADPLHLVDEIRLAALPAGSLECYVQLPMIDLQGDGSPSVAALRALVADGLVARFDALAVVAPLLAPGARLVIVAGDRAGKTSDSDLGLPDISRVLAEAVLASHGAHNIHPTVVGPDVCASDIAGIAWAGAGRRVRRRSVTAALADFATASPDLSYVAWRDDLLLAAELSNGQCRPSANSPVAGPAG
jgi:hypothetical protein